MGKGLAWIFLQRWYTGGQQTHRKMLNITNYWRNANWNHNEIISRSLGYYLKNKTNIADDVKKWKILYLVG